MYFKSLYMYIVNAIGAVATNSSHDDWYQSQKTVIGYFLAAFVDYNFSLIIYIPALIYRNGGDE